MFNAELPQERQGQGPRSQEAREDGTVPNATLSPPEWVFIKMGSGVSHLSVSFIVRGSVPIRQCPCIHHNF